MDNAYALNKEYKMENLKKGTDVRIRKFGTHNKEDEPEVFPKLSTLDY